MQYQPTNQYPTAPIAPHGNNVEAYRLYTKSYALYVEACKQIRLSARTNPTANPLAFRCTICMQFFSSRNLLFRHLKDTHFDKKKPCSKENQTPCKRTGRKERIRKLESQIQNARINSTSTDNKPSGIGSAKFQKFVKNGEIKPSSSSVRKLCTLPEKSVVQGYDVPAFEAKPGKNSDLDFEFLDIPGFTTTDYVATPNGTLAIEHQPSVEVVDRVLENYHDSYEYTDKARTVERPPVVSFRFSDEDTKAGPKHFEQLDKYVHKYTKDAFLQTGYPQKRLRFYDAPSLNAAAPPFNPSGFSQVAFEPGHDRRESIFSRVGDDELFDSE